MITRRFQLILLVDGIALGVESNMEGTIEILLSELFLIRPGETRQDFRTGPYFIMHTLLCFMETIAITIDVLWDCGALFFLFRGFFQSLYGLKKVSRTSV